MVDENELSWRSNRSKLDSDVRPSMSPVMLVLPTYNTRNQLPGDDDDDDDDDDDNDNNNNDNTITAGRRPPSELTPEEKQEIRERVFEVHGFFPDLRSFEELPRDIRAKRDLPKGRAELDKLNKKYYTDYQDPSERAFRVLVDLGMMEDYSDL
mmetsp:Transcript_16177/g.23483  ORF Transcript_16177/g.23483 Transcript_16177/m.23483 type:complete len:153 (-) Transcript_16177:33-491(-)